MFSRGQLLERGIGPDVVDRWLATSQVERVHRGVFAFDAASLTRQGRWMAAVLAVGADAALSHSSAAALWGIRRARDASTEITTRRRLKRRPGLLLRCLPLGADEVTVRDGIPTTTPGRTLFDLAHSLRAHELEAAMREAEYLRLAGGPTLPELIERYPGKRGIVAVRRLVESGWSEASTRSELESAFVGFVDRYALPRPERNALIDLRDRRIEVDFLWRAARTVVELDGYAAHGTRHAFEHDRDRDRELQLLGFVVIRVTWRQLRTAPERLASDLRGRVA